MTEKKDALDHDLFLPTLDGKIRQCKLPSIPHVGGFYALGYQNVFQAVLDGNTLDRADIVYIQEVGLDAPRPVSEIDRIEAHIARWDTAWDESPEKEAITSFLKKHGGGMKKVDKVIGIGLGRPGDQVFKCAPDIAKLDHFEQSYFQHLTLLHIANVLRGVQNSPVVDVFVQDPAYTDLYRNVLTNMANKHGKGQKFEQLDDLEAFLRMDDQTVVFHCFVG